MLALYTNLSLRLRRDEKGATAVEYGIMVALIAVVIIVAVSLLGGSLERHVHRASSCGITTPAAPTWDAAASVAQPHRSAKQSTQFGGGYEMPPPNCLNSFDERPPCRGHPNVALPRLSSRFWPQS